MSETPAERGERHLSEVRRVLELRNQFDAAVFAAHGEHREERPDCPLCVPEGGDCTMALIAAAIGFGSALESVRSDRTREELRWACGFVAHHSGLKMSRAKASQIIERLDREEAQRG